jgi:hypothetical protein
MMGLLARAFDLASYRLSGWSLAYFGCAALVISLQVVVVTGRSQGVAPRRAFAANSALVAVILVLIGATLDAGDEAQAAAVSRMSLAGLALVGPSTLHFICALVGWRRQLHALRAVCWGIGGLFAALSLSTRLIVDGAWPISFGWSPRAGLLLPVHLLLVFVIMVIALAICAVRARSASDPLERRQLRYVVLAYAVGTLGVADVLPAWGIRFIPTSFAWLTMATAILTYAMREHQLLDAPDLGWRALGWFLTSALVAVPLGLFFALTRNWHGWGAPAATAALLYFMLLVLRGYYARVQPAIDDIFLRRLHAT